MVQRRVRLFLSVLLTFAALPAQAQFPLPKDKPEELRSPGYEPPPSLRLAPLADGPPRPPSAIRFPLPLQRPDALLVKTPLTRLLQQAPAKTDDSCLARLTLSRVSAIKATPLVTNDACTIEDAVQVRSIALAGGEIIDFPDRPLIACAMAERFTALVQNSLAGEVKSRFGVAPAAVGTGPGHECRPRNRIAGAKMSAHSNGLAIDMAWIRLAGSRMLSVEKPADDGEKQFWTALQAKSCGPMHTVLGPNADKAHANHIHLDIERRGRDGKTTYCH